jgi:hypothetical protein
MSWDRGNKDLKMAWMRISVISKRGGWRSRNLQRQRQLIQVREHILLG